MPLYVVATPIGNLKDITLRAREVLTECDVVIGEEHRVASTLLKRLGLSQKEIYLLNEHTKDKDLKDLVSLCAEKRAALITDCGTPGFADPGADLVRACRARGIAVQTLPGPSSLMAILSLSGQRLNDFVFAGFLPANREERAATLRGLAKERRAIVILETPYRFSQLLQALADTIPSRRGLVGLDLTQETEQVHEGTLQELSRKLKEVKAEPVLLIYPAR